MSIPREQQWPADKVAARAALMSWRRGLSAVQRTSLQQAISQQLDTRLARLQRPVGRQSVLAVYWPIRAEPDLRDRYPRWRDSGFTLALPVTPAAPGPLRFAAWMPDTPMACDKMGIQTPADKQWVQPDVMIIPCLGYAAPAWRLGYGGGYYDRTLQNYTGEAIGIAFPGTRLVHFKPSAYDIALSEVITGEVKSADRTTGGRAAD